MTLETLTTTTILLGIAASLFALTWLVYEIDRLTRRRTLARGLVLSPATVRINNHTWDLPKHSNVRTGQRIILSVLEA